MFKFDKVFREATRQDEIYADTQPLVRSVLDGEWEWLCLDAHVGVFVVALRVQNRHSSHSGTQCSFISLKLTLSDESTSSPSSLLFSQPPALNHPQASTCASLRTARPALARHTPCQALTLKTTVGVASTTEHWMICSRCVMSVLER